MREATALPHAARLLAPLAVLLVVLAAWQAWVVAYDIPPYLVPSPLRVWDTLAPQVRAGRRP